MTIPPALEKFAPIAILLVAVIIMVRRLPKVDLGHSEAFKKRRLLNWVPLGLAYDVHPVHLGIIFIANLELGYLTPPVGLNLFLASYRFRKPLMEVAAATLPMLFVLAFGVLVITYVPWLTTGLLGWMGRL